MYKCTYLHGCAHKYMCVYICNYMNECILFSMVISLKMSRLTALHSVGLVGAYQTNSDMESAFTIVAHNSERTKCDLLYLQGLLSLAPLITLDLKY